MEDNTAITAGSDAAPPVDLRPMSEDEGERAIANLLIGNQPSADPAGKTEAPTSSEPSPSEDEDDGLVFESDDGVDEPDGSQAPAPVDVGDDYMVTLQDGQQISLGDLKRNNLFQRDYTFKTEALKQQEASLRKEVSDWKASEEQRLVEQRNQILDYANRHMPKAPNPELLNEQSPHYDPIRYLSEESAWKQQMGQLEAIWQQSEQERMAAEQKQQEAAAQNRAVQQAELFNRLPKLKDAANREAFRAEINDILPRVYKVDAKDVELIENAGYMQIVHDAIAYQKLKAKSVKVTQDLAEKPKLEGKQRSTPQTQQARDSQGRFETLRKTGSVEDADRALEAFFSSRR